MPDPIQPSDTPSAPLREDGDDSCRILPRDARDDGIHNCYELRQWAQHADGCAHEVASGAQPEDEAAATQAELVQDQFILQYGIP